jgi:hypothetical protein
MLFIRTYLRVVKSGLASFSKFLVLRTKTFTMFFGNIYSSFSHLFHFALVCHTYRLYATYLCFRGSAGGLLVETKGLCIPYHVGHFVLLALAIFVAVHPLIEAGAVFAIPPYTAVWVYAFGLSPPKTRVVPRAAFNRLKVACFLVVFNRLTKAIAFSVIDNIGGFPPVPPLRCHSLYFALCHL